MSDEDDKVKEAQSTYIPKGEESEKDIDEKKDGWVTDVPLPPDAVMKSAFLTAIKYRSVESALNAFRGAIKAKAGVIEETASLNESTVRLERTIALLNDAHTIHQRDKDERDDDALRAKEQLEQTKHQAYMDRLRREAEKRNAEEQHRKIMNGEHNEPEEKKQTDRERELWEHMEAETEPLTVRKVAEQFKKSRNLTPEQIKKVDAIVEAEEEAQKF